MSEPPRPPTTDAGLTEVYQSACGGGPPGTPPEAGRYRIEGEIGHGGMGVVFRAHDPDFDRTLAVKVLAPQHANRPDLERRFLEEAHLTGRLQHPGIAPVHAAGRLSDGRPFFSMKLIEGRTLAAILRERTPGDVIRLLKVFEQVCQTVAYAHSHGVIHRDLKPSNVMVGTFGEVQVLDWGLAKELTPHPPGPPLRLRGEGGASSLPLAPESERGSGGEGTQAGAVVGTFAYAPPEQARGEDADERADVFGLGAMLCEILTGRPPYHAQREALWQKARSADLIEAFARLDGCRADTELVALAKRCLAARREDRPGHAGEVAAAVAAYLAAVDERARQAEQGRAAALARAEEARATAAAERRARRLSLGLGAAGLLLLALIGGGAFALQRQADQKRQDASERAETARRREAEYRQAVVAGLDRTAELRKQQRWNEARVALERTRERLGEAGPDDLRERAQQEEDLLALVDKLDAAVAKRATLLDRPLTDGGFDYASVDREFAKVFEEAGIGKQGDDPALAATRVRQSALAEQLLAALDCWASTTRKEKRLDWILAVARQVDPVEQRNRLRDPAAWRDDSILAQRMNQARAEDVTPPLAVALALRLSYANPTSIRLLKQTQRKHPSDFWLARMLGISMTAANRPDEAIGYYRVALAQRPKTAMVWRGLASCLRKQKQFDEADGAIRTAIELTPNDAGAHHDLGEVAKERNRLDEAVAAYLEAIRLRPKEASWHVDLGIALREQKKPAAAATAHRKAIALDPELAEAHYNLGVVLLELKKPSAAAAAFRQAIELKPEFVKAHGSLGVALMELGKPAEALAAIRKAIDLKPDLAESHYHLGVALRQQKKLDEAADSFRKAIALKPDFVEALVNLGFATWQRKPDEAIAAYRKAIALRPDSPDAYVGLGVALGSQGQTDDALAALNKATSLNPGSAEAHAGLGTCLVQQKKYDKAAVALNKAITLNPALVEAHYNLGVALSEQKKPAEAAAAYRKAIELDPDHAGALGNLGVALLALKKPKEAAEAFRKVVGLKPDDEQAHRNLGLALLELKKTDAAAEAFRKAIALKPDYCEAHGSLGLLLFQSGKLDEALAAFRKVIDLKPDDAGGHSGAGIVLRQQKKLEDAVASLRKADQLKPNDGAIRNELRLTERLLKMDRKVAAVQAGKEQPRNAKEQIELAEFCLGYKEHYRAASRFYADAFDDEPELAADLSKGNRYRAACCAALAAAGKGEDAGKLSDKQREALRRQALRWLRADLTRWAEMLEGSPEQTRPFARLALPGWKKNTELAAVRDKGALAKLSDADRAPFVKLWSDVDALLRKVNKDE